MKRKPLIVAITAALMLLVAAGVYVATREAPIAFEITADDRVHGSPDAPITIVEYASFTCPHCAAFQTETLPRLTSDYIDTGKVKLVFRDYPTHPIATMASTMTMCETGDRYHALVNLLFAKQAEWIPHDPTREATRDDVIAGLAAVGREAGMSHEQVEACINSQENLDQVVADFQEAQARYHIDSTPTFLLGGKKYIGAYSYEQLKEILDGLLAGR